LKYLSVPDLTFSAFIDGILINKKLWTRCGRNLADLVEKMYKLFASHLLVMVKT